MYIGGGYKGVSIYMKRILTIFYLFIHVNSDCQTPPIFIHQDIYGKVKLMESKHWFNHLNSFQTLTEYNSCKEVSINSENKNNKSLKECHRNFDPTYTLQQINQDETNLIPIVNYSRIYRIKRLLEDSLIFEIFGESDEPTFSGVIHSEIFEKRKYNSDSLLTEIVITIKQYGDKFSPLRWEYIYEGSELKYVLLQQFDSTLMTFQTYRTLEWIYQNNSTVCNAYLEYSGSPLSNVGDSIESWRKKLVELEKTNLWDQNFDLPYFEFNGKTIFQFYFFTTSQNQIVHFIGYENELFNIYEGTIVYNDTGNIREYSFMDYWNWHKLHVEYFYDRDECVTKKKEKIKEKMNGRKGRPKYHDQMTQWFYYNENGQISHLEGRNSEILSFQYE